MADQGDTRGLLWGSVAVGLILFGWFVLAVAKGPAARSHEALPDRVSSPERPRFPVTVRTPSGPPRVIVGVNPLNREPLTASCSSCHATRVPDATNVTAADLDQFHQGLVHEHGTLRCLSCHNPDNYDELRWADGRPLAYRQVMLLCGQCHSAQYENYLHGAHGGMTGHWDLSRGPRTRNNCIDCHDPHAPAFPKMRPTFKPKDRFLASEAPDHE